MKYIHKFALRSCPITSCEDSRWHAWNAWC